jgi:6-phosphogluconolactonase
MDRSASPRSVQWHEAQDANALAAALSKHMQQLSLGALNERGVARIGLAGGSTPMAAYADYAASAMPWPQVQLVLIDERFVPLSDSQSNEANIASAFAAVKSRLAVWQGLYQAADSIVRAAAQADTAIRQFGLPLDATVIGMGTDGHIASLFVESADFAAAVDAVDPPTVMPIRFAAGDGKTDRLSFSLPALLQTRHAVFCITGTDKRDILQGCLDGSTPHMAAARFLARFTGPVEIFWSPA